MTTEFKYIDKNGLDLLNSEDSTKMKNYMEIAYQLKRIADNMVDAKQ